MEDHEKRFVEQHPQVFFLRSTEVSALNDYLRKLRILGEHESVLSATRAGEGNMNCTLRVRTPQQSLIVKQSRPWVQKYPQIAAPWDRILSEARFYMLTSPCDHISAWMPKLLELDPASRVLILEDMGEARDFTAVYRHESLTTDIVRHLAAWLAELHALRYPAPSRRSLTNREMRQLNHIHIFELPLQPDNSLELDAITPGLQGEAHRLAADSNLVASVCALGQVYLADGLSLLHGDFFPGSWLATEDGAIVIDPEFAFFGRAEFDVGVFLGHLHLAGQSRCAFAALYDGYQPSSDFDWSLVVGFAGCEIMRRLIGVAQLPLDADLQRKQELLRLSRRYVLSPGECLPTDVRASAG